MSELKRVLLLEPDYMLRHTIALTARSTGMAEVHEAASLRTAQEVLRSAMFDGLLLSLDGQHSELELVEQLRSGKVDSAASTTVVVMVAQCDAATAEKLRTVGVDQIILRPFKVKTLLDAIQRIGV